MMPPPAKSGAGASLRMSASVAAGLSSRSVQAAMISPRLCAGMSVVMPTAMPVLPLSKTLGTRAGSNAGSCKLPSKFCCQSTVPRAVSASRSLA